MSLELPEPVSAAAESPLLPDDSMPPRSLESRRAVGRIVAKAVVSVAIVYHAVAILLAPASIPPSSELMRSSWRYARPYLQFLYLNHGFHFFAPDPGAATIVRYVAELPDGTERTGQVPDKRTMWPRLLYHRHFMLTEYLAASDDMDPRVQPLVTRALARGICRREGAKAVSLSRVVHLLPDMESVRSGMTLDDSRLYEEQPIGRFEETAF